MKTHWLGILHVFAIHSTRNPVPSFYICLLDSGWRQISFVHIAGGGGADEKVISQLYNLGRLCSEMEKAADAADMSVLSQLVLIFRPRARKTMREESFSRCIISTRAISTSAISINSAFSCYLQICHIFFGYLRCFVAIFLVLIFWGLFCVCAI